MKKPRPFPSVTVTRKQENRIKDGHPWVYAEEIVTQPDTVENGSLVDVMGTKGNYLGTGFWSQLSQIRIRILDHNANETFSDAFFARRVHYAVSYRRDVMRDQFSACRLIHGEADGLPGLTVDRYNDILVSEVLSYGTEQKKDVIYSALLSELNAAGEEIHGIYERNEGELRKKKVFRSIKAGMAKIIPLPVSLSLTKMESCIKLTLKTARRPDSSWIRNTTVLPFGRLPREEMCWTAAHIPVPLP